MLGPKLSAPFTLDSAEYVVDFRVGGTSAFGQADNPPLPSPGTSDRTI